MNQETLKISDEMLSAFLDDELPPMEMAAIRAALLQDQSLADRLAVLTLADQLVRQHAQALDQQPLPASVLALLETGKTAPASGKVLSGPWLEWRRGGRPLALAASVLVVLGLSFAWQNQPAPLAPYAGLPELAQYADYLDSTPSGTAVRLDASTLLPRFSFRSQDERYCRQYQLINSAFTAENIACRENAGWTVLATVSLPISNADNYLPASSVNTEVDEVLNTLMQGPALDLDTEAALIRQQWQDQ